MESLVEVLSAHAALGVEMVAVLTVFFGALEALWRGASSIVTGGGPGWRKRVWRGFAMWLILGLEFALAADIIRTVVAPSWNDIGQLAAIAAVRTALNYFLEKDLEGSDGATDEAAARAPVLAPRVREEGA